VQRQGEAGGGGTERVGVEARVASSEERRVCEGGLALARLDREGRSGRRGRADVFSRLKKGAQRRRLDRAHVHALGREAKLPG
jgi:hypothetical protein